MLRKILKWALWGLFGVGILLAAGALLLALLPTPRYDVEVVELEVDEAAERVANGRRLAGMLCRQCHFDTNANRLSGRELSDLPSRMGAYTAPNITRHPDQGIGEWSAGEIAYLLRTGVHPKSGRLLAPFMPRWPKLASEDLEDLVAFLMSDDPWVEAADTERPASKPSLLAKWYAWTSWEPYPYPSQEVGRPDEDDAVGYGRYLVDAVLQCHGCHAASLRQADLFDGRRTPGYLGGGAALTNVLGGEMLSGNITPHPSGIGDWSEDEFRRALRDGFRPDGKLLRWPMVRYAALSEREAEAIYAYLLTVPSIDNVVERSRSKQVGKLAGEGRHYYLKYGCQYCHGESGIGVGDLRGIAEAFPKDEQLIAFIEHPEEQVPDTIMPSWEGVIPQEELPALAKFVRDLSKHAEEQLGKKK